MSKIYEAIGRMVVAQLMRRHRRTIWTAGVLALTALLLGGYLAAARRLEEG
jgi:hypothetical protein